MDDNILLLDCTLRDGGYVNDWCFGSLTIRSVVSRLDSGGIDIIECGFLDSNASFSKDRTMYPDTISVSRVLGGVLPKHAMLVAMVDYGTFGEEMLIPQSESVLDGIRLIFKKENVEQALEYACRVKELGYKLFINPVALSSYTNVEAIGLVERVNKIKPFCFSIVDTYGLMFDNDVEKYLYLLDSELDRTIALGYHCHNNLQMANAHCISFINKRLNRKIIIDSSILGMGKNAGNACTELIGSYLNKFSIKDIELNHVLDCAYTDIARFRKEMNWGYNLNTFLSAIHDCSPNWMEFLMNKYTLSIGDIRKILDMLPIQKREVSYFNTSIAEEKYVEYLDRFVNDEEEFASLAKEIEKKDVLLLCPGKSLSTHRETIDLYILEKSPIVMTVNFVTDTILSDYAFISNGNRYSQMIGMCADMEKLPSLLLTSNIVPIEELSPLYTFNYKTLYDSVQGDSSVGLIIALLKKAGINSIAIAGMDGFDIQSSENNYFDNALALWSAHTDETNQSVLDQLHHVFDNSISVRLITPSLFEKEFDK